MSRQNKVNPGMYTQRGRLTQDDAARELAKQRNVGSPHTWQPAQRDKMPAMFEEPEQDEVETQQTARPAEPREKMRARVKAKAASTTRKPAKVASKKTGARKSAVRKAAPAKKATTASKRGKAKSVTPAKAARGKARSAKR